MGIRDTKSEIAIVSKGKGPIPANMVQGWIDDADDTMLSTLTSLYLSQAHRFLPDAHEIAESSVIPFAFQAAAGGSSELTRYEGLEIVACLFQRIWKREQGQGQLIKRLKIELSKLILNSSREHADRVITAVLEHIFVDVKIRHFFSDWERDGALEAAFSEAVRLADGWIQLDRSSKRRR